MTVYYPQKALLPVEPLDFLWKRGEVLIDFDMINKNEEYQQKQAANNDNLNQYEYIKKLVYCFNTPYDYKYKIFKIIKL